MELGGGGRCSGFNLQYNYTIPSMVMLSVSTSGMNANNGNENLVVALLVTLYPYTPGYLPVTVSVLT